MPATTTTTLETFLDLLKRSGAIDPRRLDGFLSTKYGVRPPDDPAKVANDLIEAGLLTKYHTEPLLAGRPQRYTLSGKYRMIDRLGSGGMASVFLCEHRVMRRRVAVKMLPPSVASNASALDRFHREARAMAGVHHPNIVGAHDVDQDGKIHFIVMEYVDGTNFHELIRRVGPLPVERAAHYIAQAAKGLQHAHDKGLVHRDIKPANLLLDRHGTVKILDLGLALVFQATDDNLTRDHDANSILGTAEYLAPEQAVDSHNVDHRADIYSLGMTLYFILSAQTPFGEGTTAQKLIWHQLRQPKPIRDHRPDVSEELWAVLAKMLAKDPAERYQTMQDVADALSPWTGSTIPPPAEREMPKPLAELTGDWTSAGDTSSSSSYSSSSASLPSPLEAPPTDRNGRSSGVSPPPVQEVNFAMPGGLDAGMTPTLPVSAAPTDPKKPASSAGGAPKPVVAVVAAPSAPASSKTTQPKAEVSVVAVPAKSSPPSPSTVPKKASVSGVMAKSASPAAVDDDDDKPTGKPKSKKIKKKEEKKSNAMLYAVGGGGVALLAVIGLVLASGGSNTTKPTASTPDNGIPSPPPTKAEDKDTKVEPPKKIINTGPLDSYDAGLTNVAFNGRVRANKDTNKPKELAQAAFDDDKNTHWVSNSAPPWWIIYEFANGVDHAVEQYGIVSSGHPDGSRDPKDWRLEGSSDGIDWKVLDERKGQTFTGRRKLQVYIIERPTPYRYYRLFVTANGGAKNLLHIAEIGLYSPRTAGMPMPPLPGDTTLNQPTETLPLPRDYVEKKEPTVTADFFPLTAPEPLFFATAINKFGRPPAANRPWAVGTQKWTLREPKADPKTKKAISAEAVVEWVQFGYSAAPNVPPQKQSNVIPPPYTASITIDDEKRVQVFTLEPGAGMQQATLQPILQIGAKKDTEWSRLLPDGTRQMYEVAEFGTREGRPSVTVKTEIPAFPSPRTGTVEVTYVFVKGLGLVEQTNVRKEPARGAIKAKNEVEYEFKRK